MFTYKRPNEISSTAGESFLAEGPTNEILDVYVSLSATSRLFYVAWVLWLPREHPQISEATQGLWGCS